ncbi:cytochrome b562 [Algibacillus agarilyticus]|uniref:cytochrome b562 n=1 Tax=Algibacillus agarilyticus TaxID=2234133 RepID=UPI000DD09F68|nr:cytochrome b562 [Algibacillus agarilyticus]
MFKASKIIFFIVIAGLVACSRTTPLQDSMQGMAKGIKTIVKAQAHEDKEAGLALLQEHIAIAKLQKVRPDDQEQFDEGLTKIEACLAKLATAVASKDDEQIMAVLKELKKIKQHYHEAIIDEPQS